MRILTTKISRELTNLNFIYFPRNNDVEDKNEDPQAREENK